MLDRTLDWLYGRLGRKYWLVLAIGQGGVSIFVVITTLAAVGLFLEPPISELVLIAAVGSVLAIIAPTASTLPSRPVYDLIEAWHDDPNPSDGATVTAWRAASTLVLTQYRTRGPIVNSVIVIPTVILGIIVLHLDWLGILAL